ncbi:hypothetical protein [Paenibacillus sp. 1P03SA]|uniref:hypothetical protein n=1 Tax=Paenibacillus sp. 1P03SA TaxID=3132294 RepID=UPI0039A36C55
MYLKKTLVQGRLYWSIVESFRDGNKVKQRTIKSLGTTENAHLQLRKNPKYGTLYSKIADHIRCDGKARTFDFYFVVTGKSSAEYEVISDVRPPQVLVSYHYFKNKPLKDFVDRIGYKPKIILDSGAYSAFTQGKNIALLDYMAYIQDNSTYIDYYISLDVIGDSEFSYLYYVIMKQKGLNPVPVYHYGEDESHLVRYIERGETYIALGGTVPISDKQKVADWVQLLCIKYPDIDFHLLGSSSPKIVGKCNLRSCDSSTWIMLAQNGQPSHIKGTTREAKIKRAKWQMHNLINRMDKGNISTCRE